MIRIARVVNRLDASCHDHAPVTAKGQVTLRSNFPRHLGVRPGDKIVVSKLPDGRIEVKVARPAGKISDAFDILKRENGLHPVDRGDERDCRPRLGRQAQAVMITARPPSARL